MWTDHLRGRAVAVQSVETEMKLKRIWTVIAGPDAEYSDRKKQDENSPVA